MAAKLHIPPGTYRKVEVPRHVGLIEGFEVLHDGQVIGTVQSYRPPPASYAGWVGRHPGVRWQAVWGDQIVGGFNDRAWATRYLIQEAT